MYRDFINTFYFGYGKKAGDLRNVHNVGGVNVQYVTQAVTETFYF